MIPRVGPVPLAFLQFGQRLAWVDPGRAVSQAWRVASQVLAVAFP